MKRNVAINMIYLLKKLWQLNKKTFTTMCLHILCGALTPFLAVIIPSVVIQLLLKQSDINSFALICGLVIFLYGLLRGSLSFLSDYNDFSFISTRCGYFMEKAYIQRGHVDYAFLEDQTQNTILEDAIRAMDNNTIGIEGMYHEFINFSIAFLGLVLYVLSSGGLNICLTLGLLLFVTIQYFCFTIANKYEDRHRKELDKYLQQTRYLNDIIYDTSAGKDIRLFQLQSWIDKKFEHVNRLLAHRRLKDYSAYMLVDCVAILLDFLRDAVCYGFLIYKLVHGLPIDQFVFYLGIITGFSLWFKQIGEAYAELSKNNILTNRFLEAMQMKNVTHHGDGKKIQGDQIEIVFDHVSFQYPKQTRKILDDVSFTMHANEKLALVGVNGAGKTTVVKLILGFYLPSEGSIRINGIDTRDIDVEDIYEHITGIFQDSTLMSYTIAENISMTDITLTDREKVRKCLKHAGLWKKIEVLQKQELTHLFHDVEADGIQLSGGQMQKLLMARVLYREQCQCLLLDEPTAALDALAEKEMYESYHELSKQKTSLFISHRLSSTRFCDEILVLNQGKIVEKGNHEQLLKKNGIYANMFEVQSKYYMEEGDNIEDNNRN